MNIKQLRLKHSLSQQDVADKTGIPRPRIAKWEEGKANPKTEDYKILENFFASIGEVSAAGATALVEAYPEKTLSNLSESNKVLAEANKTLAEANKTLAEANHVISKNHDELIQLTKMIVANSGVSPRSQQEAFGPENNVEGPGFAKVVPSGTGKKLGK
jgi:transcriptional regulator with XRE-family HTH domain